MNKCLFISRHVPTEEQVEIAKQLGYDLVTVGDCNAFDQDEVCLLLEKHLDDTKVTAIACVHPLVAVEGMRLGLRVLVFENANRASVGEKPEFHCCGVTVVFGEDLTHYEFNGEELY